MIPKSRALASFPFVRNKSRKLCGEILFFFLARKVWSGLAGTGECCDEEWKTRVLSRQKRRAPVGWPAPIVGHLGWKWPNDQPMLLPTNLLTDPPSCHAQKHQSPCSFWLSFLTLLGLINTVCLQDSINVREFNLKLFLPIQNHKIRFS